MATSARTSPIRHRVLSTWDAVSEGARRRREAKAAHQRLVADLATYTTRAEIDDLVASTTRGPDESGSAEVRAAVVGNLREHTQLAGTTR